MSTLQERIRQVMSETGATVGDLALAAGVSSSAVSQWLSGNSKALKAAPALGLEARFGYSARWLTSGVGVRKSRELPPDLGEAHATSYKFDTMIPPEMGDENIVSGNVPAVFRRRVEDDSGGPDYPAGSWVIWSTVRKPKFGSKVLIKDRHGRLHMRVMQQGRDPGAWIASPLNPAYATLDSALDGLEVVACFDGFQLPPEG